MLANKNKYSLTNTNTESNEIQNNKNALTDYNEKKIDLISKAKILNEKRSIFKNDRTSIINNGIIKNIFPTNIKSIHMTNIEIPASSYLFNKINSNKNGNNFNNIFSTKKNTTSFVTPYQKMHLIRQANKEKINKKKKNDLENSRDVQITIKDDIENLNYFEDPYNINKDNQIITLKKKDSDVVIEHKKVKSVGAYSQMFEFNNIQSRNKINKGQKNKIDSFTLLKSYINSLVAATPKNDYYKISNSVDEKNITRRKTISKTVIRDIPILKLKFNDYNENFTELRKNKKLKTNNAIKLSEKLYHNMVTLPKVVLTKGLKKEN